MKLWIAGARYPKYEEWFLFGTFATEREARAAAEKHTQKVDGAMPVLFECELGKVESGGLMDCYEPISP